MSLAGRSTGPGSGLATGPAIATIDGDVDGATDGEAEATAAALGDGAGARGARAVGTGLAVVAAAGDAIGWIDTHLPAQTILMPA